MDDLVTYGSYTYGFQGLWDSIYHGQRGKQWADNPYVFALTFELVQSEDGK